MPAYVFRCKQDECASKTVHSRLGTDLIHPVCLHGDMLRDYRSESVGIGQGVRESRAGAGAAEILPTAKDFQSPQDPTGERGMKEWLDSAQPREGNKKPRWPTRSERTGA